MIGSAGILLGLAISLAAPQNAGKDQSAALKNLADEMAQAPLKGDHETLADLTHPNIVKIVEGRKKFIALVEKDEGRSPRDPQVHGRRSVEYFHGDRDNVFDPPHDGGDDRAAWWDRPEIPPGGFLPGSGQILEIRRRLRPRQ